MEHTIAEYTRMLERCTDPEERDRLKLLIKTIEVQLRDYDRKKKKGTSSR